MDDAETVDALNQYLARQGAKTDLFAKDAFRQLDESRGVSPQGFGNRFDEAGQFSGNAGAPEKFGQGFAAGFGSEPLYDPSSDYAQFLQKTGPIGTTFGPGIGEVGQALARAPAGLLQGLLSAGVPRDIVGMVEADGLTGRAGRMATHIPAAMDVASHAAPYAAAAAGIRAYHGTPHDFDKFELSPRTSMTGEGAQKYGHGLYLAESEDVAKNYRDALSPQDENRWLFDGEELRKNMTGDEVVDRLLNELLDDPYMSVQEARSAISDWHHDYNRSLGDEGYYDARNHLKGVARDVESRLERPSLGHMYETEIGAPVEQFLDWDKPLHEQSPFIQQVLRQVGVQVPDAAKTWSVKPSAEGSSWNLHDPEGGWYGVYPDEAGVRAALAEKVGSGKSAYYKLGGPTDDPVHATEVLRKAGVPGIRFLDQFSRGSGEGTHNLTVFDDALIDIVRKYGIAGLAAIPAISGAAQGFLPPPPGQSGGPSL